ncbi:hypothetical protein [Streptomyces xylophagus]|uniref:hypothetical protein n=1 Tax=Streptomyces xylophagus TaxID=285514 RepID=UPI0005B81405|nr:hypothetical protein [Streptomyces xylophagus]
MALLIASLISAIVGLSASICFNSMVKTATSWACLSVGGGAFLATLVASVAVIGLFDFTDTRPSTPPQPLNQGGNAE